MFKMLIIPIIVMGLTQFIKIITKQNKGRKTIESLTAYGGMPSSHTAYITSLGLLIALNEGVNSPVFALWFMISVIVIKNALGLRQEVSRHSIALEKINQKIKTSIPSLTHRLGHKPSEVLVGFIFGIIITLIFDYLWRIFF